MLLHQSQDHQNPSFAEVRNQAQIQEAQKTQVSHKAQEEDKEVREIIMTS